MENKKLKVTEKDIKEFNDFFKSKVDNEPILINVPKGINYIGDWKDFKYPYGHVIMDKTVCGCGFTEYCLTSKIPTIVASPRKALLENKFEQHQEAHDPIYYFRNESELAMMYDYEKKKEMDEAVKSVTGGVSISSTDFILGLKRDLINYLSKPPFNKSGCHKIIVTYDSLHYVLEVLKELGELEEFSLVIDEFQSLFTDSAFKPEIEYDMVNTINSFNIDNVMYLSATPLMSRYIAVVPEFNQLPFYKLVWPDNMIEKISFTRRLTKSLSSSIQDWVEIYRNNTKHIPTETINGTVIKSKEVVFFVNSVKLICDVIRKTKMHPNEVNIICSKTSVNTKKLAALNEKAKRVSKKTPGWLDKTKDPDFTYGTIPTKDQPHKMFTFCTRTAYLGADFYSKSAITIICSDINITTLNVDVSLDLPQIVGRQRLKENLFKNRVIFYYKKPKDKGQEVTLENFIEAEVNRLKVTHDIIDMSTNYEDRSSISLIINRSKKAEGIADYLVVKNEDDGSKNIELNHFLRVSVMRSYEISRPEYQDQVIIKREYDMPKNLVFDDVDLVKQEETNNLIDFRTKYESFANYDEQFKYLCQELKNEFVKLGDIKYFIDSTQYNAITLFGIDRCKTIRYRKADAERLINDYASKHPLAVELYKTFKEGHKYSVKDIKEMLKDIYKRMGISKNPKATDLIEYFEVREVLVFTGADKRSRGFLIISKIELK